MFTYRTPYRFYTLAKAGFSFAYLWYVSDLFKIHSIVWSIDGYPIPAPSGMFSSGHPFLDSFLRGWAVLVSTKIAVWIFFIASPFVTALFLFARRRWLQCAVGIWLCFSMISLHAPGGVFNSTADTWVIYAFLAYVIAALVQSDKSWAASEPGLNAGQWRANPTLDSTYAWLVVLLQFSVYFFAGVNKLVYGWDAWMQGYALENLAYDTSMRNFVRGLHVSHLLSVVLCYYTLFQRLIVPFGFYFRRWRIWTVLILGSMHVGYAILMHVNLFPVIGLSCLAMVLPPGRKAEEPAVDAGGTASRAITSFPRLRLGVLTVYSAWMLLEPTRLAVTRRPVRLENNLMLMPAWRMFADGGTLAGDGWRLILETPKGKVDVTGTALELLPQLWRDRFYIDIVLHDLLLNDTGPGSLPQKLAAATTRAYQVSQVLAKSDPTVLNSTYVLYSINPRYAVAPEAGKSVRRVGTVELTPKWLAERGGISY